MLRPDELEQLSRLLAGDLPPDEEARLWADLERRPKLAEGLARLEALDALVSRADAPVLSPASLERAISRALPARRTSRRWLALAVAAMVAAVVGATWLLRDAPAPEQAPPTELQHVERRVASVRSAPETVLLDEGEGVSRLVSGTALFEGDHVVLVDGERLVLHGKVAVSTNPPEGLAHVTALVTPTPEESEMISRATTQWATATTLAVLVFSGEVMAQTKVSAGQAWAKKPAERAKPPEPTKKDAAVGPEPGCESCTPTTDREGPFEVKLGSSPSLGPTDAKVTVVIFSEAECPFCVKSHEVLKELQKLYAGRVRFVFKHYPLPRHAGARQAAIALHAAAAQGRFWEMVESAYGSPVSPEEGLYDAQARALGLDLQQYRRDVASPATAAVIDADIAEGKRLGVQGVPAWFINGREVVGHRPLETLRELIDAQLAK